MSGDHDRASKKPAADVFFPDAGAARPPPRARRQKPPPGIITAGGVDMARAHASGIKIRETSAPAMLPYEPRVVIAVETDARKVPTHPRLAEGRGALDARNALLPVTPDAATSPPSRRSDRGPSAPPRSAAITAWASGAFALAILVIAAVGTHRTLALSEPARVTPRVVALLNAMPRAMPPPPPISKPAIAIEDLPAVTVPSIEDAPKRHAPSPRPPPRAPTATAKAVDFMPPFELPTEKKRD